MAEHLRADSGRPMSDLDRAAAILRADPALTCVFVRGEESFSRTERGIVPLAKLCREGTLPGWSAADRIVGRAAALLYRKLNVRAVYAETLSDAGEEILSLYGIAHACARRTKEIVNRRGDGPCPMEEAVRGVSDPETGARLLEEKLAAMARSAPNAAVLRENPKN